ncbi:hypothetical protein [Mycolicibacterium austroafricanum]|uniref:hypothetical protein n=1 Tax=Mycolicibacterium austroafricanum TaxID=39687 RepID=UPI001CA36A0C|nr:hypothetical protein [Mycolicibacterium austroafricanum]QZT62128.1 hypothetical protein JN085_25015 [Mycolicibacterium austroafricanum]
MTDNDNALAARVKAVLEHAVAGLDPADREERIAWCREHDQHGVRMHTDPDGLLEFQWGGRMLAMVRADDLVGDEPLRAVAVNAEIPDTLEGLTDD